MELTMTNGFSELSFTEMEMIDGGFNLKKIAKGLVHRTVGELEIAGSFIAVASAPTPVTLAVVSPATYNGCQNWLNGWSEIIDGFKN